MDPSSFFIPSVDIAATSEQGVGDFIYDSRSGRVFFFEKTVSACKDENPQYCPVCGNLRKGCAANEARRGEVNALLTEAQLQEARPGTQESPPVVAPDKGAASYRATQAAPSPYQPAGAGHKTFLVTAVATNSQHTGHVGPLRGVLTIIRSRAPPRR